MMLGQTKRKAKLSLSLPYGESLSDASHHHGSRFVTIVRIPIPQFGREEAQPGGASFYPHAPRRAAGRFINLPLPIPPRVYARIQQLNPILRIMLGVAAVLLFILGISLGGGSASVSPIAMPSIKLPTRTSAGSTVVVSPDEIAKVWEWEVTSGHHPSAARVPATVALKSVLINPVVPARLTKVDNAKGRVFQILGRGPARQYRSSQLTASGGFPHRPIPGSILDLDTVLSKCDFSAGKYTRDCLELLRLSGGLDNGKRVRDERFLKAMQTTYTEYKWEPPVPEWTPLAHPGNLTLPEPRDVAPAFAELQQEGLACFRESPRIFHMFWFGPFGDKLYLSILSFLFTQNLGLDKEHSGIVGSACWPLLWVWVERSHGDPELSLREEVAANPWSAPFVSARLSEVIQFREWRTDKQLDSVSELKGWRDVPALNPATEEAAAKAVKVPVWAKEKATAADYDRLVALSHLARFVVTHRYGGIYLEPDTVFLRDWEEVWGYRGQFAYRHAAAEGYNTAVLKMHRQSALGSFVLATGVRNGGDFTPQAVTRYLQDAQLERLLFRAPSALFDPAWLTVEKKQLDRPPFPIFDSFINLFDGAASGAAEQLGFDAFFRGAFSYHFHNGWWRQVDPRHNFPELGDRFARGETTLREAQRRDELNKPAKLTRLETVLGDALDLPWSAVLKRTFEAYLRGERGNMYGEMIEWGK